MQNKMLKGSGDGARLSTGGVRVTLSKRFQQLDQQLQRSCKCIFDITFI